MTGPGAVPVWSPNTFLPLLLNEELCSWDNAVCVLTNPPGHSEFEIHLAKGIITTCMFSGEA